MKEEALHMDIKPELATVYQFINTLMLGAFALIKTPDKFFSVLALALFIAHLLDVSNSMLILANMKPLEMDVLALYVIIDIFTLMYLYHCFRDDHVDTVLFKFMTVILAVFYAYYTIQDAINWDLGLINQSVYLYALYAFTDIAMLMVILWNEAKKDSFHLKKSLKKLKKKK